MKLGKWKNLRFDATSVYFNERFLVRVLSTTVERVIDWLVRKHICRLLWEKNLKSTAKSRSVKMIAYFWIIVRQNRCTQKFKNSVLTELSTQWECLNV